MPSIYSLLKYLSYSLFLTFSLAPGSTGAEHSMGREDQGYCCYCECSHRHQVPVQRCQLLQKYFCWLGAPSMFQCKVKPGNLNCYCRWLTWCKALCLTIMKILKKIQVGHDVWQTNQELGPQVVTAPVNAWWWQHFSPFLCKIKWVMLNCLLLKIVCRQPRVPTQADRTELQANVYLSSAVIHNL